MHLTQQPRLMHKGILHAIQRQLLTLAMGSEKLQTLATGGLKKKY